MKVAKPKKQRGWWKRTNGSSRCHGCGKNVPQVFVVGGKERCAGCAFGVR